MAPEIDKKAETHRKVVEVAAGAIREFGPGGIGVADLMKMAGLTHGGFYAHFESKEDLIAQAISRMFDDGYRRYFRRTDDADRPQSLARFIDGYLSERHRDTPARGCPLPSLSGEVARLPPAARARFSAGIERLTGSVTQLLQDQGHAAPRALATSMLSEMVGAVALSRVMADPAESARFLSSTRETIKSRLGLGASDQVKESVP